jgi:hypothetical protein
MYNNCIRNDDNCEKCTSWDDDLEICMQDDDLGGTGHGDESFSDADSGL